MSRYSHVFSIAFAVESSQEDGMDVTQNQLIVACLARIADLTSSNEWLDAVQLPEDTYEIKAPLATRPVA